MAKRHGSLYMYQVVSNTGNLPPFGLVYSVLVLYTNIDTCTSCARGRLRCKVDLPPQISFSLLF